MHSPPRIGRIKSCFEPIRLLHTSGDPVEEHESGNETEITIERIEMDTGWVCFQGGETPPAPDQLPFILNDAFSNWLRNNPEFKVRTVLPIVVEGNTIAINIWFD